MRRKKKAIARTFTLAHNIVISEGIIANSVLNIDVSTPPPSSRQILQYLTASIAE